MPLKKVPVVVRLSPKQVHEADLMEELRINPDSLDRELLRQPAKYAWWAALYSETASKVELLRQKRERLEGKLFVKLRAQNSRRGVRVKDINHLVHRDGRYRKLSRRLRRWESAERLLKFAERAFSQRKDVLMALNANQRREKIQED